MNKKLRIYTIYSLIFFTILMMLLSSGVLLYSRFSYPWGTRLSGSLLTAFIIILTEILLSFFFIFLFKSIFTKTSSPEVFFIIVALSGISCEAFRTVVYLTHFVNKLYLFYAFIPRLVYFGKLVTALALFISGLFSTGFPLQKQNTFLGLIFLFAFLLSTTVPIDFSVKEALLLPGTTSPYIMQNILYSFYILAFANYVTGALIRKNHNFALAGIGLAFLAAGIELIFPLNAGTETFLGFGLFISGTSFSAYEINKIYNWM